MVNSMNTDFGKSVLKMGHSGSKTKALRQIVQEAEAKFIQEKWTVDQVTNAQNIFNFILSPVKNGVEEPEPSITIPVVLLVMNREEAEELDSNKIKVEMPKDYLDAFKNLKVLLKADWLDHYGKRPEEWRPFEDSNKSIEDWMIDMFEEVRVREKQQKSIIPDFIDIRTLPTDRKKLKALRANGCFVINDVISMWHPVIQHGYRASLLDAFPSTFVFRISPIDQALQDSQPLIAFTEKYSDLEFFKRTADFDLGCRNFLESQEFAAFVVNAAPGLIAATDKETSVVTRNIIGARR